MILDGASIARRLQRMMRAMNVNQKELARQLNITQPAVSKYLQGRIPPADVLLQLAGMSHVSIEWILTGRSMANGTRVSEPVANYRAVSRLHEKIDQLPPQIRSDLEKLVDSLAGYF
jgi:transcriptional regulator with XRE-family HTH domain